METEKLYYQDPFLKSFSATVLSCEPSGNSFSVILDRTAFYPEGGGQPADWGVLNSEKITDVQEKDGWIVHTSSGPFTPGSTVEGSIDWIRRFDHMQQHSGEHILSGILCNSYHCDNIGFHLGADTVTIDYNTPLTWDQILQAEQLANTVIAADHSVKIAYPSPEELKLLDYRSKKELTGQVRIVTFPEADCCACCGTHVLRAGQVGLVKALSVQKFRDGVRIEIVCGQRALSLFSTVYEQNRQIAQALSVKFSDTAAAVTRTLEELSTAKLRMAQLEEANFFTIANSCAGQGNTLLFSSNLAPDGVRKLADAVARQCGGLAAVFSESTHGFHYALIQPDGSDISPFVKSMNAALQGRGGGRNGFAQGSVQATRAAIHDFFFSTFSTKLIEK